MLQVSHAQCDGVTDLVLGLWFVHHNECAECKSITAQCSQGIVNMFAFFEDHI